MASLLQDLQKMRARSSKRVQQYKRFRLRNLSPKVSVEDIEDRIEQLAREEEEMTLCEHGVEVA
jgi:hypothetical protein